jgi:hypothetical protein
VAQGRPVQSFTLFFDNSRSFPDPETSLPLPTVENAPAKFQPKPRHTYSVQPALSLRDTRSSGQLLGTLGLMSIVTNPQPNQVIGVLICGVIKTRHRGRARIQGQEQVAGGVGGREGHGVLTWTLVTAGVLVRSEKTCF